MADALDGDAGVLRPDYWRQTDIVVPSELPPVTVVGAGGIGSFTLLALAKMGCERLTVFDDDTVEVHNIPNQLYMLDHIGCSKVEAASSMVKLFTGTAIEAVPVRFDSVSERGVVVSGVDSMLSRKEIWEKMKYNAKVPFYIDTRMGAEVSRIFSINPCDPDDIERYEASLYTDEEALDVPCTARAIVYNGFAIASLVANQVKKWSKGEELKGEIVFDLVTLTLLT